jgi:hypothetical protein
MSKWLNSGKPVTPLEASIVAAYLLIALGRQVARDLKTIWRLTKP